jgi:hypothetical protein
MRPAVRIGETMIEFLPGVEPWVGWLTLAVCGAVVGVAKTGVPGIGIMAVVAVASVMDTKQSVGFMLPLLIVGDVFAVAYYRRHAVWSQLVKLMPAALAGIVIGYFLMDRIDSGQLRHILGAIVIVLLALDFWYSRGENRKVPSHWIFGVLVGMAAGITTMLANAAGPLITLYFLAMRFDKRRFIGTAAWYFMVLNWVKVPFFLAQDPPLITTQTLASDLLVAPAVVAGALLGVFVLKRIPQIWFVLTVKTLTLLAALRLLTG